MRDLPLLSTKFLVPRLQPDHLPRERLVRQLGVALYKRLVLLSAPPGYGKTTLLALFARQTEIPLIWYQLDATDNDPILFLHSLVTGFRMRFPGFAPATTALLEDHRQQPDRLLAVLLNEVTGEIRPDVLLVLEDYHAIRHPDVHRLVQFLLDHQPPQLHLLLSTREEPPLSLAGLRAAGELIELRAADLRFTTEEISQLTASLELGETLVDLLAERTEGWPAGLQLALAALAQRPGVPPQEVVRRFRGNHRFVFDYLAEEVFERQPREVQDFLLRSSILEQMSAPSCNDILGIDNAKVLLEELEKRNLFLQGLDEERRWYRYHQLFRDFLLDRLYRQGEEEPLRLHARAGDYYAEQGMWDLAAEHYVAARSVPGLSRAVRALAPCCLQSGRLETLYRYLLALPPRVFEEEPDLLLYQGQVFRHWGRVEEAVACYERARSLYEVRDERNGLSRALSELAYIALSRGEYRDAQRLAQQALGAAGPHDHLERSSALMALARSTGFLEGMERGCKLGEEALREAEVADPPLPRTARARLLLSQAQLCWWYGDPFATVGHCQAALDAEPEPVSPIACRAFVIMVSPHLYWGNFSLARDLAQKGLALSEQLQYTEWRPMAHAALGMVLSRQGQLALGEKHLREAISLARRLGAESYAQLMAAGYLAANLSQQGRLAEARRCCEEVLHLYEANQETYEYSVCRSVLGDVLMDMGDLDTAWEYFLSLRQIDEARQFRLPLAMVHFALGYLHLLAGRRDPALEAIRDSMEIIRQTNTVVLYLDQGQRAAAVCRAALEAGICPDLARRILGMLGADGQLAVEPCYEARTSTEPVDRRRPFEIVTLGGFRVFYEGREIGKEAGLVGRPREMLAYFITHRYERLPLDRIVEDLWPGCAPEQGQAVFHTTLHRLRRALSRVAGPGTYVRHDGGEYQLEAEAFRVDVDTFEACLQRARSSVGTSAQRACEEAAQRYGGAYLVNLYADWCEAERRRLTSAYLEVLRTLVAAYTAAGDYTRAVWACERMLEVDPLLEEVHCELMRLWHRMGNRAAVIRQYERLVQLLAQEVCASPLPETQRLLRELLARPAGAILDNPGPF